MSWLSKIAKPFSNPEAFLTGKGTILDPIDLFGAGKEQAQADAKKNLQDAVMTYALVGVPVPDDLKYKIDQYVQAGIISSEDAKTMVQNPSAFNDISVDPTGRNAEMAALGELQDISKAGGNDAQYREAVQNAEDVMNTQLRGQREAIMQNAAQRGTANAGTTLAAELSGISDETRGANAAGVTAASDAEKRALEALTQSANIGGNVTGQDYMQEANKAAAIDAINRFNTQNAQGVESSNVAARNAAQKENVETAQGISNKNVEEENTQAKYNAALPQQTFEDQLKKAQGISGALTGQASGNQQNAQNAAAQQGSGIGAIGSIIGSILSEGGEIEGEAPVSGDSPENDIVPALLSPGEIVIPRSAAKDPVKLMDFLKHLPKAEMKPIHPHDLKSVFHALTSMREECEGGAI